MEFDKPEDGFVTCESDVVHCCTAAVHEAAATVFVRGRLILQSHAHVF